MSYHYWILLLLSAILYAIPFWDLANCWWMIFIFPIPFFWVVIHNRMSWREGYIWGLSIFVLHLWGVLIAITKMAHGPLYMRVFPSIFIILYQSLFTALFFWITQFIIDTARWQKKPAHLLALWMISLYKYLFFIDTLCLFAFDRFEGYAFMHPLVPLAQQPALLSLLPFFGKQTLTLMVLIVPATLVLCFLKKKIFAYTLFALSLLFWIISLFNYSPHIPKPLWLDTIAALPQVFFDKHNPQSACEQAAYAFKKIIEQNPAITLIITPESALYFDQLHNPSILRNWNSDNLSAHVHIMIGAFRWKKKKYHNSLHWIHDGCIQHYFDKRHTMLLTERIPSLFGYPWIKDLYFKNFPEMSASSKERPIFTINQDISLVPYICSELFFNDEPDDFYPTSPILALCNDRWLAGYIPRLMHCLARFKAIEWQRPILYISFRYQSYCDIAGNEIPITTYLSQDSLIS